MALSRILFVLALLVPPCASAQRLALTFDDGLDPARQPRAAAWNDAILATLRTSGVPAMFFPALSSTGTEGLPLVARWSEAGHPIGNHTARHRNLGSQRIALDEFVGDVTAADAVLSRFPTWRPMLRFPFLKEGDTREKRDGMRAWMREHGYRPAQVSIDASDWYYSDVFVRLTEANDAPRLAALKPAYVAHLLDRAAYYDGLARNVVGRSPAHVLLLHVNAINAAWLGDVLAAFRARGWTFVPPLEAYADPMYAKSPDVLPAGESLVWALAKEAGIEGLRYPGEDSMYEEPIVRELGVR